MDHTDHAAIVYEAARRAARQTPDDSELRQLEDAAAQYLADLRAMERVNRTEHRIIIE